MSATASNPLHARHRRDHWGDGGILAGTPFPFIPGFMMSDLLARQCEWSLKALRNSS